MRTVHRILTAGLALVVAAVLVLAVDTGSAFAASSSKGSVATAGVGDTGSVPALAPKGCNSNNFCSYNAGNGGSLCFQTAKSVTSWPSACRDHNDGAYNRNGNSVNLYYFTYYGGAYSTLYSGNYWLYMSKNHFTTCGNSCDGQGLAMQNNVESHQFN
jgi:hypothetical protein